jgi:hypothetical protein
MSDLLVPVQPSSTLRIERGMTVASNAQFGSAGVEQHPDAVVLEPGEAG